MQENDRKHLNGRIHRDSGTNDDLRSKKYSAELSR